MTESLLAPARLLAVRDILSCLPAGSHAEAIFGSCTTSVRQYIAIEAYRELSRPLGALIASRSLCFLRPEPPLIYPSTEVDAGKLWEQGAGLAVQHIELRNSVINVLCGQTAERERCVVTASLYISQLGSTSMSEHVDAWDAWLLQVEGRKCFKVRRQRSGQENFDLSAGDWLFIPKDTPHAVSTPSPLSIHLSINLHRQRQIFLTN